LCIGVPVAARGAERRQTSAKRPVSSLLSTRHAVLLGLVHGPTELLPVSSSAHTAALPLLLGWHEDALPAEQKTAFEVALHAGAVLGLAYALRNEPPGSGCAALRRQRPIGRGMNLSNRGALLFLGAAVAPPATVGYTLERRFEHHLGGTRAIVAGLLGGGLAMALADLRGPQRRYEQDASARDGLWLGLAQALALAPGISRNGATLTAARALGFTRADAQTLSWRAGMPVIVGATLLKGRRALAEPPPPGAALPFATGALASLLSTLACAPLLSAKRRRRALWPFALYRAALALLLIRARAASPAIRTPVAARTPVVAFPNGKALG
jgi:undecaprenyl-diphosphatase